MIPSLRRFLFRAVAAGLVVASANGQQTPKLAELVPTLTPPTNVSKPADKDLTCYLLVYFKDETHSIYFATSKDGYTFTDVNNAQPVVRGQDVAEQKGVRDPHIMRGPDGAFYMAMTDLHLFGQRMGYRTTRWERPQEEYEWGNNQALVLMKSFDLIHWAHSDIFINKSFPEYANIGCAWAPETIVDPSNNKLMVYFTTRIKTGPNFMVYSYADSAFTKLETTPQRLFTYPNPKINTIDGDITRVGDKYHFFYVAHESGGGVRHAVSDQINQGYDFEPARVDPERVGCEAPNLWHRAGTDTYVLMDDVFGAKPHNMGFSETTDFIHYKNIGRFNDPGSPMKTTNFSGPKHGAVMAITSDELNRLNAYFSGS